MTDHIYIIVTSAEVFIQLDVEDGERIVKRPVDTHLYVTRFSEKLTFDVVRYFVCPGYEETAINLGR